MRTPSISQFDVRWTSEFTTDTEVSGFGQVNISFTLSEGRVNLDLFFAHTDSEILTGHTSLLTPVANLAQ